MKFLVTGAAGFIGSHLVDRLLKINSQVVGVDSLTNYYSRDIKKRNLWYLQNSEYKHFHFMEKSILDLSQHEIEGLDGIFHLAGEPGVRQSWDSSFDSYLINNLQATNHLLSLNKGRVPFLYASSSSVYGEGSNLETTEDALTIPKSPYGVSKLACEYLVKAYASRFGGRNIGVRFFTVYGPRQRPDMAFAKICNSLTTSRKFKVFGDGNQTRDFLYISDAVHGVMKLFESANSGIYNLSGQKQVSLNKILAVFQEISGLKLAIEFSNQVPGDVNATMASLAKVHFATNWQPEISIEDGIAQQWKWHKAYGTDFYGNFDSAIKKSHI